MSWSFRATAESSSRAGCSSASARLGARAARAGEFTLRAFLNDRIDLAQAEAIADLIDSASAAAARCARRSLSGEFSRTVGTHRDALVSLRSFIEASIDFPDEELDLLGAPETAARLVSLREAVAATLAGAHRGTVLRSGVRLVIAGPPNVGSRVCSTVSPAPTRPS